MFNSTAVGPWSVGAGTSATAYADIAHFSTNITPSDTSIVLKARSDTSFSDDCKLPVIESYEFGLGAKAGAYVAFDNDTWGPTPQTSLQIFYTTLYSACAISAAATASSGSGAASSSSATAAKRTEPARLPARDDAPSTMGFATSEYTLTNVVCETAGLANCPASLQSTSHTTKTSTVSALVAAGVQVTVPATTDRTVSTKAFGTGVKSVPASSGVPVSYVPPTTASSATSSSATSTGSGIGGAINDVTDSYNGLSESNKKLAIGLSAGLGGALLTCLVALAV